MTDAQQHEPGKFAFPSELEGQLATLKGLCALPRASLRSLLFAYGKTADVACIEGLHMRSDLKFSLVDTA